MLVRRAKDKRLWERIKEEKRKEVENKTRGLNRWKGKKERLCRTQKVKKCKDDEGTCEQEVKEKKK